MMDEALRQYSVLTRTLLTNNLSLAKATRNLNSNGKARSKIATAVLTVLMVIGLCGFGAGSAVSLTVSALNSDRVGELLYVFLAIAQVMVFFFGAITVMSNLYYSKDNATLASLPFRKGVVFSAKFTVAYIGELAFSALVLIPMLTASGITLLLNGYGLPWTYFVAELFAVLLVPALPLLVASLIALPLMYIVSALKKRSLGNGIVMSLFYVLAMALYFATIAFLNGSSGGKLSDNAIRVFDAVKRVTIFNYPMVNALLGNKFIPLLLAYFGGVAVITTVAVCISVVFYKKALSATNESGESAKKPHKSKSGYRNLSILASFYVKELKTFAHTPVLFMSVILAIVMPAFIMFFYGKVGNASVDETFGQSGVNMYTVALLTFFGCTMISSTNQVASVGFSREGKSLFLIKSLPVNVDVLLKSKLLFATTITVMSAIVSGVVFPFATGITNPVAIVGLILTMLVCGLSMNCISLYNDLKNPNLTWSNLNEITKNNKRLVKPMLLAVGINFVGMILGIVIGVVCPSLSDTVRLSIYYGGLILAWSVVIVIAYLKLKINKERLFAQIGG